MLLVFVLLQAASLLWIVNGLHNITVDDTATVSIVYQGSWGESQPSSLDYGGTHKLSVDPSATATFTFTGVAVYFMSPLWPYSVNTQITLDSGSPVILDLVDHSRPTANGGSETVQSQVVWGVSGLVNAMHTVVASMAPGGPYVVVDAFIYTVVDAADTTSLAPISTYVAPSTPSTPIITSTLRPIASPATSSAASAPSLPNRTLAIILGGVFGAVGVAVAFGVFLLCRRRTSSSTTGSTPWTLDSTVYPPAGPPLNPSAPSPANSAYWAGTYQPHPGANQALNPSHSPQMRNAAWPSSYHGNTAMTATGGQFTQMNPNGYPDNAQQQLYDLLPAPVPRNPNPTPGRGPYQVNTLSTITESSVGPYAAAAPEFGYQGPSEGSDRISSVASESRPTSSYQPPQLYGGQKEKELGRAQEYLSVSGTSEGRSSVEPPAYIP